MPEFFQIEFEYALEGTSKTIRLRAEVEKHSSPQLYVITAIKSDREREVLPVQMIKRLKNQWVHSDSEKETYLSQLIGSAIQFALRTRHLV